MPTIKKNTTDIASAEKAAAPKKPAARTTRKTKPAEEPMEELRPEVVEAINVIKTPPPKAVKEHERIFALDIGTRSVIGIVAEEGDDENLHVIATDRLEHKTRRPPGAQDPCHAGRPDSRRATSSRHRGKGQKFPN